MVNGVDSFNSANAVNSVKTAPIENKKKPQQTEELGTKSNAAKEECELVDTNLLEDDITEIKNPQKTYGKNCTAATRNGNVLTIEYKNGKTVVQTFNDKNQLESEVKTIAKNGFEQVVTKNYTKGKLNSKSIVKTGSNGNVTKTEVNYNPETGNKTHKKISGSIKGVPTEIEKEYDNETGKVTKKTLNKGGTIKTTAYEYNGVNRYLSQKVITDNNGNELTKVSYEYQQVKPDGRVARFAIIEEPGKEAVVKYEKLDAKGNVTHTSTNDGKGNRYIVDYEHSENGKLAVTTARSFVDDNVGVSKDSKINYEETADGIVYDAKVSQDGDPFYKVGSGIIYFDGTRDEVLERNPDAGA